MSLLPEGAFGERVARRLRDEIAIWLTTIGADGTPQPNPVWFIWDGAGSVLIYSHHEAARLRHIDKRPAVSLNLDGDGGNDVVVLTGTVRRDDTAPPAHENADYVAKYGDGMARVSGSREAFTDAYSVPLRVDIHRIRGY